MADKWRGQGEKEVVGSSSGGGGGTAASSNDGPQEVLPFFAQHNFALRNDIIPVSAFPDESFFEKHEEYPALIIPAKQTKELRKELKTLMLLRPKTSPVQKVSLEEMKSLCINDDHDDDNKLDHNQFRKLLLKNGNGSNVFQTLRIQALIKKTSDDSSSLTRSSPFMIRPSSYQMVRRYKDLTVDEVLKMLLPLDEIPSAFESVGHIAHINLKEEALPFQHIIGKVILDKNAPRIRTVVNKLGTIESKYRTFGMKVIAGDDSDGWNIVSLKEEGTFFDLDFQNVYWNSRLSGEHKRLVKLITQSAFHSHATASSSSGEQPANSPIVVADAMAGVGPFAVPLTSRRAREAHGNTDETTTKNKKKKDIVVFANDLNPVSYEYLQRNSKRNRCSNLHCWNMDGRAFLHRLQEEKIEFDHVIMNLPATAPEFLDALRGFSNERLPMIHVHCFAPKDPSALDAAVARCSRHLGCEISSTEHLDNIHIVRDVAPNKNMLCVSFRLPEAARGLKRIQLEQLDEQQEDKTEPKAKRVKTSADST